MHRGGVRGQSGHGHLRGAALPGWCSQVLPVHGQADAKTRFSMVRHKYVFVGSRPFSQCWRISVGKGGCKVAQTESGQWSWLTSALRF